MFLASFAAFVIEISAISLSAVVAASWWFVYVVTGLGRLRYAA